MILSEQRCYGSCPTCGALNMANRRACYRCRKALPDGFWRPDVAICGLRARMEARRPSVGASRAVDRGADGMKGHAARRQIRRPVNIMSADIEGYRGSNERVTVRDISSGGLQYRSDIAWAVGDRVRMRLTIGGREHTAVGVVRYCRPVSEEAGRRHMCGIEFITTSPGLQCQIVDI